MSASALHPWQIGCLKALECELPATGPFVTSADVGAKVWPEQSRATASQAAAQHLRILEKMGLVLRADEKTPIIWGRTRAGTSALSRHIENSLTALRE